MSFIEFFKKKSLRGCHLNITHILTNLHMVLNESKIYATDVDGLNGCRNA